MWSSSVWWRNCARAPPARPNVAVLDMQAEQQCGRVHEVAVQRKALVGVTGVVRAVRLEGVAAHAQETPDPSGVVAVIGHRPPQGHLATAQGAAPVLPGLKRDHRPMHAGEVVHVGHGQRGVDVAVRVPKWNPRLRRNGPPCEVVPGTRPWAEVSSSHDRQDGTSDRHSDQILGLKRCGSS